jgi:hypothetical protein
MINNGYCAIAHLPLTLNVSLPLGAGARNAEP